MTSSIAGKKDNCMIVMKITNPSRRQSLIGEIHVAMIDVNLKESRAVGINSPPNKRSSPNVYVQ